MAVEPVNMYPKSVQQNGGQEWGKHAEGYSRYWPSWYGDEYHQYHIGNILNTV